MHDAPSTLCSPPHAHPYRPPVLVPFAPRRAAPTPRPFRLAELGAAAALVAVVEIGAWSGLGLAVLLAGSAVVLFLAARRWRGGLRLGVLAGMLAVVALRAIAAPSPGCAVLGAALLIAFALALRARDTSVPALVDAAIVTLGRLPSRLNGAMLGVDRLVRRTRLGKTVLLPVVVPVALVLVFLGIFALANPVVAHAIDVALHAVSRVIELPSIGQVVFWGVTFVAGVALVRPARRFAKVPAWTAAEEATEAALLVARNALLGLDVLFLGYNALDARYLWTGTAPAGMSTQHYAHEGAFWLTIALVLLTGVVSVMFRGALATDTRARGARILAFVWIAQGFVLALGTYRRIAIHIARSGLSDLRIVGILGTTLVVAGLAFVAWRLYHQRDLRWLVRRQLDAFAIAAALYVAMPTHLVSARVNVARALGGETRPLLHAFRQTRETESVTTYVALLDHPDPVVREGIAALLLEGHRTLAGRLERRTSWRDADLATGHAFRALEAAKPRIDEALATTSEDAARSRLFELTRAANEER